MLRALFGRNKSGGDGVDPFKVIPARHTADEPGIKLMVEDVQDHINLLLADLKKKENNVANILAANEHVVKKFNALVVKANKTYNTNKFLQVQMSDDFKRKVLSASEEEAEQLFIGFITPLMQTFQNILDE